MNKIIVGVLVVLTLAVGYLYLGSGLMLGKASGPSHFQHESFLQGLSAGVRDAFSISNAGAVTSTQPVTLSGTSGDLTVGGGTLAVTTTNTATSSATIGCIQTTATSTATPIRFLIGTSGATTTISRASQGVVVWGYGTCPN